MKHISVSSASSSSPAAEPPAFCAGFSSPCERLASPVRRTPEVPVPSAPAPGGSLPSSCLPSPSCVRFPPRRGFLPPRPSLCAPPPLPRPLPPLPPWLCRRCCWLGSAGEEPPPVAAVPPRRLPLLPRLPLPLVASLD